jgi:hypothetical protein
LSDIPGFNIDRVAAAAGDDPDVLRLENLDTDIRRRLRPSRRLVLRSARTTRTVGFPSALATT